MQAATTASGQRQIAFLIPTGPGQRWAHMFSCNRSLSTKRPLFGNKKMREECFSAAMANSCMHGNSFYSWENTQGRDRSIFSLWQRSGCAKPCLTHYAPHPWDGQSSCMPPPAPCPWCPGRMASAGTSVSSTFAGSPRIVPSGCL